MTPPDLVSAAEDDRALKDLNTWLETQSASDRIAWAVATLPDQHALSSSFGAQSAAVLHLVTRSQRDIPVILIDTGYLFPETYRFADDLTERLGLNLKVYRPSIGVAWMEARLGRLWEQGLDGLERYNRLRKVEPMQRALTEIGARTWI
ncbi:MAG TPA: phosphoadenylyl-sulfate reductase, partial [Rhodanobacteraceae bacterium]|nr:phosphoadenylyl-sulfate reductase [Rhodanobacteraceae bacterium]